MNRRQCVRLIQALGLSCVVVGLYLGWVEHLAIQAAAIRGMASAAQIADAASPWAGMPDVLLLALRGPAVWIGLAVIIAAPLLPIPDGSDRPRPPRGPDRQSGRPRHGGGRRREPHGATGVSGPADGAGAVNVRSLERRHHA